MERISCKKPRTFYNLMSGEKVADDVVSYLGFACGWYICGFADGRSALYDDKGRLVAEDFDKAEAVESMYLLQKGDVSSLFAADGKLLMQTDGNMTLYLNGWVETLVGGVKTLYRPDMSPAASGYTEAVVMADGAYYLTQEKNDGPLTLFNHDGIKLAEKIMSYQFFTPDFYALVFANKTVVYDTEAGTECETSGVLLKLRHGKMFTAFIGEHEELFRADGTLVLTGYDIYKVFTNGMYLATLVNRAGTLFYPDGSQAADNVFVCDDDIFCNYLQVFCEDKRLLFNEKAELLGESDCDFEVFPNGWFFCGNGYIFDGVLCRGDKSVVQEKLSEATVFDNGWYITHKSHPAGLNTLVSLYNSDDELVVESIYDIEFDEEHLCYVLKNDDGTYVLRDVSGEVLVSSADEIVLLGNLLLVQRGFLWSLYAFDKSKEGLLRGQDADASGTSGEAGDEKDGNRLRELFTEAQPRFTETIMFCGVEDDEGNSLLF